MAKIEKGPGGTSVTELGVGRLVWSTPPAAVARVRTGTVWSEVADALKARPGEWACVDSGAKRFSMPVALRTPEFERAYRSTLTDKVVDGKKVREFGCWVRFVGPEGSAIRKSVVAADEAAKKSA